MNTRQTFTSVASLSGILLMLALVAAPAALAQDAPPRFFAETGHYVQGMFLQYFNTTGGLERYGYPITDEFVDPVSGLVVQYFQKARMELHPGNPDPYKVQLGLLGEELGKRTPPLLVSEIPAPTDPNCQYFPETGHSVCFEFLKAWREKGGLDSFGYPIAEFTIENDRLVQYFQRARLEWHPEKPAGQWMQISPLGQIYCVQARLGCGETGKDGIPGRVTTVNARGSVLVPSGPSGGSQTGFVYVSDQLDNPLSGAAVTMLVHYPTGDKAFDLPPTGANGATFQSFSVGQAAPGTVIAVEFIVNYPGLKPTITRTSYMIWYY